MLGVRPSVIACLFLSALIVSNYMYLFHSVSFYHYLCILIFLSDPPIIKSLTVDGDEVDGNYIIEEGQKVNISCSFDQGNLPSNLRLSDEHGREIKAYRSERHLNASFTASCNQDWTSVRCEGNSSENSKSVFVLVKCKYSIFSGEGLHFNTQYVRSLLM